MSVLLDEPDGGWIVIKVWPPTGTVNGPPRDPGSTLTAVPSWAQRGPAGADKIPGVGVKSPTRGAGTHARTVTAREGRCGS